jgi:hypothetical protein
MSCSARVFFTVTTVGLRWPEHYITNDVGYIKDPLQVIRGSEGESSASERDVQNCSSVPYENTSSSILQRESLGLFLIAVFAVPGISLLGAKSNSAIVALCICSTEGKEQTPYVQANTNET